jgi:hypothetical protein
MLILKTQDYLTLVGYSDNRHKSLALMGLLTGKATEWAYAHRVTYPADVIRLKGQTNAYFQT